MNQKSFDCHTYGTEQAAKDARTEFCRELKKMGFIMKKNSIRNQVHEDLGITGTVYLVTWWR